MSASMDKLAQIKLTELVVNPKDDIVDGPFGSRLKASEYVDAGVPIVRLQNIDRNRFVEKNIKFVTKAKAEEIARHHFVSGDILISKLGDPLGEACIAPAHFPYGILVADVVRVRPDKRKVDTNFLAYALNSAPVVQQFKAETKGTTRPRVNLKKIRDLRVPIVESIAQQRKIVAEIEKQFTRLDAGVAALCRVQANLKRYRAAVLKAACEGRLVPTEAELAKAEGRNYETGEQLLARILADRRKNWRGRGKYKEPAAPDATNLPSLPEGWAWASLDQMSWSSAYGTSAKCSYEGAGLPVLRIPNIAAGRIDISDLKFATTNLPMDTGEKLMPGDLLVIRTNGSRDLIGRSAVVRTQFEQMVGYASYLIRFRLWKSLTLFDWIGSIWNVSFLREWIEKRAATSAGQHNISMSVLSAMPIPLPPLAEQTRIVTKVEHHLSVIEELEAAVAANIQRATRLRQSVLARAFSSEQVTQELENSNDAVLDLKAERKKRHFARALLSAEIVHQLHDEPTFGRVKHQKIFHLCEHIAQIGEIQGQYHREAAGPLDNKLIYANEAELKKQKWYEEVRRTQYGHAYQPLAKAGSHRKYIEKYWPDKLSVVEKLIEVMRRWDTDRCEMFSTTYAAWNDLLIKGETPSEVNILHEILECWHENKKRFPSERWKKVIEWMKQKGYTPTGFGKVTTTSTNGVVQSKSRQRRSP